METEFAMLPVQAFGENSVGIQILLHNKQFGSYYMHLQNATAHSKLCSDEQELDWMKKNTNSLANTNTNKPKYKRYKFHRNKVLLLFLWQ